MTELDHRTAMALQATELDRLVAVARSLSPDAWSAPTECPGWDVRTMLTHVLGACEAGASMLENARQMAAALRRRRREGGPLEAALSAVQVDARRDLGPAEIIDRLAFVAPRCIRGRSRTPGFVRRHVGMTVDGPVVERWTLGYLIDTIYLRDAWMHRIDVCRATGADLVLTADHDGVIVADVVAEWHRRHGADVALTLTGPAGGSFRSAVGATAPETIECDAVEFCRILAGREAAVGHLATVVPF